MDNSSPCSRSSSSNSSSSMTSVIIEESQTVIPTTEVVEKTSPIQKKGLFKKMNSTSSIMILNTYDNIDRNSMIYSVSVLIRDFIEEKTLNTCTLNKNNSLYLFSEVYYNDLKTNDKDEQRMFSKRHEGRIPKLNEILHFIKVFKNLYLVYHGEYGSGIFCVPGFRSYTFKSVQ